ncbi:MAG: sugar phosphate isomerase/epimerase [Kiritimatiellaeota bacterium]|nr:sugar phosphate isomerase/epimerase [Kiritimatiellota bacterium]
MQKSHIAIGATTRPCNRLTIDDALKHIASAGYKHVALFRNQGGMPVDADTSPEAVDRVRRMAEDLGLTPSLVIGSLPLDGEDTDAVDRYRRLLDNAARVGAQWVLDCGCMNDTLRPVYVRRMQAAAQHAEQIGVRITLKPHGGLGLTAEGLLETWRAVGEEAFTLCYDPGNILYYTAGELHPEDDLPKIAPHIAVGIIKDCKVENGKPSVQVTAGDGLVDFPCVLRALHEAEFAGPLYVECVGSTDFPAVDRDLAFTLGYVRGILEALA